MHRLDLLFYSDAIETKAISSIPNGPHASSEISKKTEKANLDGRNAYPTEIASDEEVMTLLKSPSGKLIATLTEKSGWAGDTFNYKVRVQKVGSDGKSAIVGDFSGSALNECAYGVLLNWSSTNELTIKYKKSRHATLPYGSDPIVDGEKLKLQVETGAESKTTKCGPITATKPKQ